MDMALNQLVKLSRREYFWIALLTLIVLAMHFSIILFPNIIILDEEFYVNDARDIIAGDAKLRAEHPPLGQLLITAGILIFGDNSFGWRFFAVLMGSASVFLLYLIGRRLTLSRKAAFLASFLLALENLTFVQNSVAMLDAFNVSLMLLAFWLYLRGDYPLAAAAGAFSVLVKLTGGLAFIAIGLHWLIARRDRKRLFILSLLLAPLLFFELLPLLDFAVTGELVNPVRRVINMLTLSGSIKFATSPFHPSTSRPWEWLISIKAMPYYWDPDYLAVISPTLWVLIIPTMAFATYLAVKGNDAARFSVLWFTSTYLVLIPLQLITDRVTYIFYFFPTVGAVCLGLGIVLSRLFDLWRDKGKGKLRVAAISAFCLYVLLHVAAFILLSPVFYQWVPVVIRRMLV